MKKRIRQFIAPAVLATALAVTPISVVTLMEPITIEAATAMVVTEDLKITKDTTWDSLTITKDKDGNYGSIVIEPGATLTINGDFVFEGGFVQIEDLGSLVVKGNYYQTSGTLNYLGASEIDVLGDFVIAGKRQDGSYYKVTGDVYWSSDAAQISVGGNYVYNTSSEWSPKGTLNLKGNYIVPSDNDWGGTVNFCGTAPQTITMTEKGKISNITANSAKSIYVTDYLSGEVEQNITFVPTNARKTIYIANSITFDSSLVTIDGNVEATSWVNVNERDTVKINGSYTQLSYALNYGSDTVIDISGDFVFGKKLADGSYKQVTGGVYNVDDTAVINVGGNYICNTSSEWSPKGTLNLKGNYIVTSDNDWGGVVVLCGTKAQSINTAVPINKLKLSNPTKTYNMTGSKVYNNIYTENSNYIINGVTEWFESKGDGSPSIKGHEAVVDKAIPATCTTKGKTEGSHCANCKKVLKAQKAIKALGHKWNGGKVTRKATTTKSGVKKYNCKRSGCGKTKSSSIAKYKFTVSGGKTFKASALKRKAASFTIKASATSKGKITYKVTSYPKGAKGKVTVSSKGKVTLKKGTKKGNYTITVTAAATSTCNKTTKKVVVKVK